MVAMLRKGILKRIFLHLYETRRSIVPNRRCPTTKPQVCSSSK